MTDTVLPVLRLKKGEDRRLRAGHLWVFSNEVDVKRTPLDAFAPGDAVSIEDAQGHALGTGYVNPRSLICARLLSRDRRYPWGPSLLVHRLKVALSLREKRYASPYYRLVHGEGDGLPGLVVDRYGDVLVVQVTTAGMERELEALLAALEKVVKPAAVLLRNDTAIRELEGLERYVRVALGEPPTEIEVEEAGRRFVAPLDAGQKTGWFYDQRDNRDRLAGFVTGGRVLDVFSYVGAWGVRAALAGAREAVCVDQSQTALDYVARNAQANGVGERVGVRQGDAFEVLRELREAGERFDAVILDPPAFIKRRKDQRAGEQAYRRLNQAGMQLLERDGFLISCSCSYHLPRDTLVAQMQQAARHLDRELQVLAHGYQSVDHPMHPAIPETAYLKVVYGRVHR
ncbi:class I SAM-dependent rRNA methyltransferase [Acidihalobacter ferrooxydans]|uniref:rRNA large subunit methyltransferase I n=1 Tax=Acidihalobacter ferrooxydans TaxID=1765967 RepID=A0A1P8UIM9_9GAMM|nr:class I SAM-dependent rRNA methyltransferase [Acidihalobacter ferrooxydans]APZ43699.1 rRNA large subunit methyltransferase I [Acidihalobacter ferrooxydans]